MCLLLIAILYSRLQFLSPSGMAKLRDYALRAGDRACGAHRLSWMLQQRRFAPLLQHPRKLARARQCALVMGTPEGDGDRN